jgi:hypothetical protein
MASSPPPPPFSPKLLSSPFVSHLLLLVPPLSYREVRLHFGRNDDDMCVFLPFMSFSFLPFFCCKN